MTHYICNGGCEGVSGVPGTCQAKDCPDFGKPLEQCDCISPKHTTGTDDELSLDAEITSGDDDDLTLM
ncbi:hypothetical protein FJZ28_01005 [Candidatus Peregrinibacteria bacterium]|nr:hypothetical protein [Candidatus Peregrinibacteria bacterium]